MNILIMTDIEGITGVDFWEQVHKHDWEGEELARERLMADTNAAVEGAFRAGADKVYVVDGHGGGTNFKKELLDPRATQISVLEYCDLYTREKIDACLEVGVHAKPGTLNAFLEHVQSSANWFSYKVNGKDYGEILPADQDEYVFQKEYVNVKANAGEPNVALANITITLNKKHDDYATVQPLIEGKKSKITAEVSKITGDYMTAEIPLYYEDIEKDVLEKVQAIFQSECIIEVTLQVYGGN